MDSEASVSHVQYWNKCAFQRSGLLSKLIWLKRLWKHFTILFQALEIPKKIVDTWKACLFLLSTRENELGNLLSVHPS